jgi:hypothetical protein
MLLAGDTDAATTAADKPLRHSSEATLSSTAWDAPLPLTQRVVRTSRSDQTEFGCT